VGTVNLIKDETMISAKVFLLPKAEIQRLQGIIDMTNELCPPIWDTVEAVTWNFGGGWEIDINICNAEPSPYVDAVLFHGGSEVYAWEICDDIVGEWHVILNEFERAFKFEIRSEEE